MENIVCYHSALKKEEAILHNPYISLRALSFSIILMLSGKSKEVNETYNYDQFSRYLKQGFLRLPFEVAKSLLSSHPEIIEKEEWIKESAKYVQEFYEISQDENGKVKTFSRILYDVQAFKRIYDAGYVTDDNVLIAALVFYLWKDSTGFKIKNAFSSTAGRNVARKLLPQILKDHHENCWVIYLSLRYRSSWLDEDDLINANWFEKALGNENDAELKMLTASALVDLGLRHGNHEWLNKGISELRQQFKSLNLDDQFLQNVMGWMPKKINT